MVENPTLYEDVMECIRQLRSGTLLEFCEIETSEHAYARMPVFHSHALDTLFSLLSGFEI